MTNKITENELLDLLEVVITLVFFFLGVWLFQYIWNGLVVTLTGFNPVTYWQAFGLSFFFSFNPWKAFKNHDKTE